MTKNRVLKEHNKTFLNWFKDIIFGDDNASETLRKYSFFTKSQDDKSTVQNSGVSLRVESQHFAIVNDDNPYLASMPYFGVM